MSLMNIMSVTLIVLMLCAGVALFFGTRASNATEVSRPVFAPVQPVIAASPDAMDDVSAGYEIASE